MNSYERNETVIEEQVRKLGTFISITNDIKQSKIKILELYKRSENIEKIFDWMKNDIDKVYITERAEGFIFIVYLSLIITSYIEKNKKENRDIKEI